MPHILHLERPVNMSPLPQFKINSLGPIHSIQAFLPLLRVGPTKKIVVIGTEGGSADFILQAGITNMVAYGMTKSSGHVATTKWALKLGPEGFIVVTLSPGLVNTTNTWSIEPPPEMLTGLLTMAKDLRAKGVSVKMWSPEESVAIQLKAIDELTIEQNGAFLSPTKAAAQELM